MRRACLVLVATAALACGGMFGPGEVVLGHDLSGEAADAARALGEDLVDGRLPEAVLADCEAHATDFPWLAARADTAEIRVAALDGCVTCVAALDRPDAIAVATAALAAPEPIVQAAGLRLAGALLSDEPDGSALAATVAAFAGDERPAARYAALEALDHFPWSQDPALAEPFLHALQADEPWLVTETLRRLRFRTSGLVEPAPFAQAARILVMDKDPGIRGRAALVLVRLQPEDAEVRSLVVGLLDDPHPYTRAAAAEAVGELGWLPAVHALIRHIDDRAAATWEMLPFERLDGTTEIARHQGSLYDRVDDAMLRALVRTTAPMGEEAFVYREVNLRYLELDVIAATRDAKRWYAAHEASLPKAE